MKSQCGRWAACVLIVMLSGCAMGTPAEPTTPLTDREWTGDGVSGRQYAAGPYRIYTTVHDAKVIDRFARVMNAAYAEYAALLPPAAAEQKPFDIYFFETPAEWDAYTRHLTGPEADVYLSVGPGAYAYGDRFVCWLFNESDLWSVAAHEGFHQYVARHLARRLPPSLEEGLATTFESVTVTERTVQIDRKTNPRRQQGLAEAVRAGVLLPLGDLVRLHAGDIARRELIIREGFYGQCWALARVVLQTPATADGLRRMLIDLRDGRAEPVIGDAVDASLYRPAAVRPLLERYLARDWPAFENAVQAFERSQTPAERSD